MFRIRVEKVLQKDINSVFDALTDHESYGRFPSVDKCVLLEQGEKEKNGKGALRQVSAGPIVLEERITAFERPTRMNYLIQTSKPIKLQHDKGEITLCAEGDATRVVWVSEGYVAVPILGPLLLDWVLQRQVGNSFDEMLTVIEQG